MTAAEAQDFAHGIRQTFAAWPNMANRVDDRMVKAWYGHLKEYQLSDILTAFRKLSATEEWAPPLCKVVNLVKMADAQRQLDRRIAAAQSESFKALPAPAGHAEAQDVRSEHGARWAASLEVLRAQGMTIAEATMSLLKRTASDIAVNMDMAKARHRNVKTESPAEDQAPDAQLN